MPEDRGIAARKCRRHKVKTGRSFSRSLTKETKGDAEVAKKFKFNRS
jgi:hypothetical protein